jgi:Flp pilus assembly protein TadD
MSRRKKSRIEETRRHGKRRRSRAKAGYELTVGLASARTLIDQGNLPRAYRLLRDLEAEYPRHPDVLRLLAGVCRQTDLLEYRSVCRRLCESNSEDREAWLMLADAHLRNEHLTLALVTFRKFLDRWPNDPRTGGVGETVQHLEIGVADKGTEAGLAEEDREEILVWHEELQIALSDRKFERAIELADRILARYPHFAPAGNNRAEALFQLGQLDDAVAECRRVLEHRPDNGFALAALARYLILCGDTQAARACADRLKSFGRRMPAWWCKTAEALSMLGDDAGVLEVFEQAASELKPARPPSIDAAFLYHYAAAATMRLGDEARARRWWKKSLQLFPGLEHAEKNLEDLARPVGERHAPWAAGIQSWLPSSAYNLVDQFVRSGRKQPEEYASAREWLLRRCPYLPRLVPVLLERGDPLSRTIAYWIASMSDDPQMTEALRGFALGKYGPDKMRHDTLMTLAKKGVVERRITVWHDGRWTEQIFHCWEIYSDLEERTWPDEVEQSGSRAIDALNDGDAELAESLLEQALEQCPGAPELLNNLCAAYSLQGRHEEAATLIERIHQEHPDYLFGRTNLATFLAGRGEIERARELVDPLLERERFHTSEFSAICFTMANIARAERKPDGLRFWADYLERVLPEDPKLKIIRRWQRPSPAAGTTSRGPRRSE